MRSRTGPWILGVLAVAAATLAPAPAAAAEPPERDADARASQAGDADVNLFLNSPADLEEFLKRLKDPDFLLIKRQEYLKRQGKPAATEAAEPRGAATVGSVAVRGEVAGELAHLDVEYGIALASPEAAWVGLRLDEQNLVEAREGERMLPVRNVPGKGWELELSGKGRHQVRVRLSVRLKSTSEGTGLELAIPLAPATRFQVDIPRHVLDATAGPDEALEPVSLDGGQKTRLAQILTPRTRLVLSWRVEAEPRVQLPPLLALRGEIAVDVDQGSFRTRSSWMIQAVRGSVRTLEFRLDPEDEVLELELDGQHPPAGIEQVEGVNRLTINLSDPLRPGSPRKLTMATRRALPEGPTARVSFAGFPLSSAREQSGAIAIAKTGNLWLQPIAGRGIRQIDPRELPADLRVRPSTALAYQFADQPFALSLRVEPSPPLVSTTSRTRVALGARQARVASRIDYRAARGGLFEVSLAIPRGLELESVGPADVVAASKIVGESPDGLRLLNVLLTPKARERDSFGIAVAGRQPIDPSKRVTVDLFQPRGTTTGGGRLAVVTERNMTVELPDSGGSAGADEFRPAIYDVPADWPWPADRGASGGSGVVALWLRHDGNPAELPLRVSIHPRVVSHQTSLYAHVERRRVRIRQESVCSVRFGSLSSVEVLVPAAFQSRWELDAADVASREDLGPTPSGDRLFRLRFGREITDRTRLKFQARLELPGPLEADHPTELVVPWIRLREGTAEPVRVTLSADQGIDLKEGAGGWTRSSAEESAPDDVEGPGSRFTLTRPGPEPAELRVVATARPVVALPDVVIPRLWIRTVQGAEGQLRTSAACRVDARDGSLAVALPPGAEWIRARVGGEAVQPLAIPGGFRLPLAKPSASSPVPVELVYTIPARLAGAPWLPPRLLDRGLIQETLWEVQVPRSRSLIGVPAGWTDENEWFWDRFVWRRRPLRGEPALAEWSGGRPAVSGSTEGAIGNEHRYLFGRLGPPGELRLTVAPWEGLVAICSGLTLLLGGMFLLAVRPTQRLVLASLTACAVAAAVAISPSVTFLVLQSGAVGIALVVVAAFIQHHVSRRRPEHSVFGAQNRMIITPAGSSVSRQVGVGSDDSTAIRARPASTVDHAAMPPAPAPEGTPGWSSSNV